MPPKPPLKKADTLIKKSMPAQVTVDDIKVESAPSPPSDPSPVELDLQTCSAQEYLARTVYPLLAPAMQLLDDVRPADPVEYLALQLSKEAQTQRERVHQLNQIHHIREQLREQFRQEYSVAGRV